MQDPRSDFRLGRRRFLQGAVAAAAVTALPLPRALASSSGGCDPFTTPPVFGGVVTDPDTFLGFPLGVDQEVTSAEANAYTKLVAAQSDRVVSHTYGTSVQGRPLRYALVGTPGNVSPAGLATVRANTAKIRDPKTSDAEVAHLAASTPVIAWVIGNIHGNEESGADTELRILYELADRTDCVADTLLEHLVVVIVPVQNPDGREADTRRNAYGFDLNRDVFARTQPETDSRVELMRTYPPALLIDDHEFGYYRAFFPPDSDPIYHEVPEQSVRWIEDRYGAAIARQFRKEGMPFFNGGIYDFFAPEYNDTGATLGFSGAGMTVEVYNGSPLSKRTHRHYVASVASLWQAALGAPAIQRGLHASIAEALDEGRKGTLERNKRYFWPDRKIRTSVPREPLRHYFIRNDDPRTSENVQRLVRRLQRMDVRVMWLTEPLDVPDYRPYTEHPRPVTLPTGTYWIPMAQPAKHWIQALLNEQPYMPTTFTYGLSGWSNPLLMNLDGGYSGAALSPKAAPAPVADPPPPPTLPSPLPAIGVYQMSVGSYAAESVGATRWLFDTVWGLPYTFLTEDEILAGELDGLDVLVAPGGDFPTALRRLGNSGQQAIVDFVNGGGRYVGYRGGGAKLALALGLSTALMRDPLANIDGCPVRVELDLGSPLSAGVGRRSWIMFSDDDVIDAPRALTPIRFPGSDGFYVSGFADGEEQLYGTGAAVDEFVGAGRLVLFPSDPNYHGHVEGMWRVLWNAVLGPDPKRPVGPVARAGAPERAAAEARARASVMDRPDWPMAMRLTVPAPQRAEAEALLGRFGAEFRVRVADGRARFLIRNPGERSLEEHPWAIQLILALRRGAFRVLSFSVP